MNSINWDEKLICIKGFRGVGKTTFLLDYIKKAFPNNNSALYLNLNNFYFTKRKTFQIDTFWKEGWLLSS